MTTYPALFMVLAVLLVVPFAGDALLRCTFGPWLQEGDRVRWRQLYRRVFYPLSSVASVGLVVDMFHGAIGSNLPLFLLSGTINMVFFPLVPGFFAYVIRQILSPLVVDQQGRRILALMFYPLLVLVSPDHPVWVMLRTDPEHP